MTKAPNDRQKASPDVIAAIRAAMNEPVLQSRHLRSMALIAAPLRENRGGLRLVR